MGGNTPQNGATTVTGESQVTVVIPTHNEAGAVAQVIQDCAAHTPQLLEILVVDDGSTDGTAEVAEAAGARVIRLNINQGKGVALRRGVDEARGNVLVFIDGDGQDDPKEIPVLLNALTPQVAMVIGSRFLGKFSEGAITRLNRLGTQFIRLALNGLYSAEITDPVAGFRVIRKEAFQNASITASRYDIEVDVLLALLEKGYGVVEVPVNRYVRTYGQTGLSSFTDGTKIFCRIVSRRVALTLS